MRVHLSRDSGEETVTLRDAGDLGRLSVTHRASQALVAGETVGPLEFGTDEHAWIDQDWLHDAWMAAGSPGGGQAFRAMLDFAQANGWTDEAGRVRAHVEVEDQ